MLKFRNVDYELVEVLSLKLSLFFNCFSQFAASLESFWHFVGQQVVVKGEDKKENLVTDFEEISLLNRGFELSMISNHFQLLDS
jgi:hypothetical protein